MIKLGVLARLESEKGIDILIKAASFLKKENIDFTIIIGGTGSKEKYLKDLVRNLNLSKNIKFLGWVDNKTDFFNEIDIFIVPSRNEPFGIVYLEAIVFQKPIISSKNDGSDEILEHQKNALIFENGNEKDLAEKIKELAGNKILKETLAQNASKLLYNYTFDAIKEKINKYLVKHFPKIVNSKQKSILNISYHFKGGGLEKAFINFAKIFESLGFETFSLISNKANFLEKTSKVHKSFFITRPIFYWVYKFIMRRKIARINPSIILVHNSRIANLVLSSCGNIPVIFINHGGSIKKMENGTYFFTVNNKIKKALISLGKEEQKVLYVPNFIS